MSRRTIQSPGIEIREIDLTTRPAAPLGTSVFVAGFSDQGPTDEIINVGTFAEFEEIYGKPTNAAERYFYHSARQVFDSDANVYVSRLPYGTTDGSGGKNRTALVYPIAGVNTIPLTSFGSNGNIGIGDSPNNDTTAIQTAMASVTATGYVEAITKDDNDKIKYYSFELGNVNGAAAGILASDGTSNSSYDELKDETIIKAEMYLKEDNIDDTTSSLSAANYYVIGEPTQVELSESEYNATLRGDVTWSDDISATNSFTGSKTDLGKAGLIVLNTGNTTTNNDYEGYYVGIADNSNINPATNFDAIGNVYSVTNTGDISAFDTVPTSRLGFALSSESGANNENTSSVSRALETFSKFDIDGGQFVDTINIGVFKIRNTPFSNTDLELTSFLAEGYSGSLNSFRKTQNENGGNKVSFFLEDLDNNSPNIKLLVNPNISVKAGDWTSNQGDAPTKFVRTTRTAGTFNAAITKGYVEDTPFKDAAIEVLFTKNTNQGLYALGSYKSTNNTSAAKNIGNVGTKLDRIFNIASNVDQFRIDVSIEAGLGTIQALAEGSTFDDTTYVDVDGFYVTNDNVTDTTNKGHITNYRSIFTKFETFARQTRKDHIFIADPFRPLLVQGDNGKVLDDKTRYFSKHVYWPLRHQFDFANSNFATTYGNWAQVVDGTSNKPVWIPFSGVAAKIYANNDANFAPWFAPAGFTRGVVSGVTDLAISPTQRQRDQLYRIAVNPVTQFPAEGMVVFGQKTLQRKPTAFDRVNVRRLFLDLEKRTRETLKFFIFEPNTFLTRNKVVNTLTPIFENAKQTEGVYDYLIVCDERNNPASVIDNNELKVDIYLKPVRAAEFILVNFYAVNTDVNFEEIIGQ